MTRRSHADIVTAGPVLGGVGPRAGSLVYDLMEPLRPFVDWDILKFVGQHKFAPDDFPISQ